MFLKMLRLSSPVLLSALLSIPAAAQIPVPPLPNLQIHISHSAPPRFRHERIPPRPGANHVWIAGSWDWQGNQWIWLPGRWDRPVDRHARWVRPHYAREYGSYRYEPGHWSNQRVIEGDDYRRWKDERHHRDRDGDRNRNER